jgi:hypothetical protein
VSGAAPDVVAAMTLPLQMSATVFDRDGLLLDTEYEPLPRKAATCTRSLSCGWSGHGFGDAAQAQRRGPD